MSYFISTYAYNINLDGEGRAILDFNDFKNPFDAVEEWLIANDWATPRLINNLNSQLFYSWRRRSVNYTDLDNLCDRLGLDYDDIFFEVFGEEGRDWVDAYSLNHDNK